MVYLKFIILSIYFFSGFGAFSESFKITCDFGSSWDRFTPRVQTHIVIDDKVYFEEKSNQANVIKNSGNRIRWSYTYPYETYADYLSKNKTTLDTSCHKTKPNNLSMIIGKPTIFGFNPFSSPTSSTISLVDL